MTLNKLYKFSCTVSDLVGSSIKFDLSGGSSSDAESNIITEGTNIFYIYATSTNSIGLQFTGFTTSNTLTLSNISLKEVSGANHGSFV